VSCLVEAALHDVGTWVRCPTCLQHFTGAIEVGLAEARWERVKGRSPQDPERLFVANNLAVTLQESARDYDGALRLFEEVLGVRRSILGDEHPDTLDSLTNLSLHHMEMGNLDEALQLSSEVVAATRRAVRVGRGEGRGGGEDDGEDGEDGEAWEEAAHAIGSLAAIHAMMGNYEESRPMQEEVLEWRRRVLGMEHLDTLNSTFGLGQCLIGLGGGGVCVEVGGGGGWGGGDGGGIGEGGDEDSGSASSEGGAACGGDGESENRRSNEDSNEGGAASGGGDAVMEGGGQEGKIEQGDERDETSSDAPSLTARSTLDKHFSDGMVLVELAVSVANRVLGPDHPSTKHFTNGLLKAKTVGAQRRRLPRSVASVSVLGLGAALGGKGGGDGDGGKEEDEAAAAAKDQDKAGEEGDTGTPTSEHT
jgi:hypothetical protein